jgi:hypothetical protein
MESRTAADIVSALGIAALAREFGHENVSTVSSWRLRDSIPSAHWRRIVEIAEARGVGWITLEALADAHAAKVHADSPSSAPGSSSPDDAR